MVKGVGRAPVSRIFSHLTDEERLDKAAELLALGVFRLARRGGLLKDRNEPHDRSIKSK